MKSLPSKLLGKIPVRCHCCCCILLLLLLLVEHSAAFSSPSLTIRLQRVQVNVKDTLHDETAPSSSSSPFVIREVREKDLVAASNILADSFNENANDNFFSQLSQRMERMNTYLSLKSRFETFRYAERSGALQCMLVGCSTLNDDDDEIIAFCEVDNRAPGGEINPAPRPYISNLAVEEGFRRRGSAMALVSESEDIVRGWGKPRLHLRVKKDNDGAKAMYCRCGYDVESSYDNADGETTLLMGKTL